jgi:hypothetical protein
MRKVLALLSGFVSLTSLLFVFAAIGDIVGESETEMGILIGLLVFFSVITAGAGYGAVKLWRGPAFEPQSLEPAVLQLASHHAGRLTVADVSVGLKVPIARARVVLDHLVTHGAAETLVSDAGELVYSVNGLLGAGEKASARGVLEE